MEPHADAPDRQPVHRPASRIVLLDERDRLLLFSTNLRERTLWITPGGGLEPGETHDEAARRELWEETGIRAEPGPCVWVRRHLFQLNNGVLLDQVERFYVVRLNEKASVSRDNWLPHEHGFMTGYRWWTVEDLRGSRDWFAPRRIAELIVPLLAGDYPAEPLDCGA